GLDVYSLWDSMQAVLRYLEGADSSAIAAAKRAFRCFEPYDEDVYRYARATDGLVPTSCEREVVALLAALRQETPTIRPEDREAHFVAEQNALVIKNAENYYRTMVQGGPESWN